MKIGTAGALVILAVTAVAVRLHFRPPPVHPPVAQVPERASGETETPRMGVPQPLSQASGDLSIAELEVRAINFLSSADPNIRAHAVSHELTQLAKRDPVAATRVADLFADSSVRPQILNTVARGWLERNHRYALAWAQGLSDANEREAVLVEIFARIADTNPADAVRLRQELEGGGNADAELANLAQRWAQRDLSAVLGWTDSLVSGEQRDQLHARVAFIQSQHNPAQAAQLVLDRIPPGNAQAEALISVVHQWGRLDPDAAFAWVTQIPESALRERARQELAAVTLQLKSSE
jgi:hypothetical protein